MADPVKLLVVANEFSVAHALAEAGRSKRWHVVFATGSEFAQPVAEKSQPDAVAIHSQLTGGGVQAIRDLQASAQTAHIPVFAVTDRNGIDRDALVAAGAQQCFEPPIDALKVIDEIEAQVPSRLVVRTAPTSLTGNLERLRALAKSQLLDSPPTKDFDELTALAAQLIDVPTVLVSLVDKDRQFFKSQFGLGEPWSSKRETPLSHSFCQWVVAEEKELLVFDAREHPVLRHNLAVRDLGVLAYAGVPLTAIPDQTIGSFCVIDSKPRLWTEYEVATIEDLAQIVNAYIVLQQIRASDGQDSSVEVTAAMRMEAASNAVSAAMGIIKRSGNKLDANQRRQLIAIVKQKSQDLLRFSEESTAA